MFFDVVSNMKTVTTTINNVKYPCFGDGEAKINLNAKKTKLYVAFEIQTDNTSYSYLDGYPLQIYMNDTDYGVKNQSTVQFYMKPSANCITLDVNGNEYYRYSRIEPNIWYRIYLVIDTVAGTIDLYLNGGKIYTLTKYVKTGVKAASAKIICKHWNNYYVTIKNLIISDEYFPPNETIIEVPATITNNGFNYDSSKNEYSTEAENSTLQATPDLSVLDGYKITACNVGMGSTVLGDTIKNIKCDMGSYSDTKEIPATGYGMYFDELPTNISNITMTAKK